MSIVAMLPTAVAPPRAVATVEGSVGGGSWVLDSASCSAPVSHAPPTEPPLRSSRRGNGRARPPADFSASPSESLSEVVSSCHRVLCMHQVNPGSARDGLSSTRRLQTTSNPSLQGAHALDPRERTERSTPPLTNDSDFPFVHCCRLLVH
jgi:hypothetical protein